MGSIRRFLTLLLVSTLILVVFSAAMHGYRAAMAQSSQFLDKELSSVLYTVALGNGLPIATEKADELAYQIWNNGNLVTHSQNTPTTPITDSDDGYSNQNFNRQRWRVYRQTLVNSTVIMVAQPLNNRVQLTESLTISVIMPFIIAVPILACFIFLSVTRGLKPLKQLSTRLHQRKVKDLSPISLPQTPAEMEPVMTTLNSMFGRLHEAFEREQQFASNAAHELRTPLSVMKINLHNLEQEMPENKDKLHALQHDTDRMIHAVNQILLLSRTSPETFQLQLESVDAFNVAQKVISDIYSKIETKEQEISLEGHSAIVLSTEFVLYTLLQNLIANANAYSPPKADIKVTVKALKHAVVIKVEDSGPGIPDNDKPRVLQRFYRHANEKSDTHGSGLGLAIVGQIVALHDGDITLENSTLGGVKVAIFLPLRESIPQ